MNKLISITLKVVLLVSVALLHVCAWGQTGAIPGFCTLGASKAMTSGLPSSNYAQGLIPKCTVTVYMTGTTNLATIYSDTLSTPLTNPFTATTAGEWLFFAATNQGYDVVLSGGTPPNNYTTPKTLVGLFPASNIITPSGTPAGPAHAVNFANSLVNAFQGDPSITIDPTAHVFTAPNVVLTGIGPTTQPVCPNGSGGALTITGCTSGAAANPAGPAFAVNFANSAVTNFQGDSKITINPTTHSFSAPINSGFTYASQYQTGSGFNGITNSVANSLTSIADPSYVIAATANMTKGSSTFTVSGVSGGTILPGMFVAGNLGYAIVGTVVGNTITLSFGSALTTNAAVPVYFYEMPYNVLNALTVIPNASMFNFKNAYFGSELSIKRDPPANPFTGNHEDFNLDFCYELLHSSWVSGTGTSPAGTNQTCRFMNFWAAAPSTNYGATASGHNPSNWGITTAFSLSDTISSKGIGELMGGVHGKASIGDGPLWYFYHSSYLGAVAGADEGQGGPFYAGGEASTTYTGTVATGGGGAGATQLNVNCLSDCAAIAGTASAGPGDGRFMLDKANPIAFNMLTRTAPSGQIPGYIQTDNTTIPLSTFWGTLSGDVLTPPALNANGIPFADQNPATTMTFTVAAGTINGQASPGPPAIGDLICFSWPMHEQAKITNVTGSGPWSVTAPLRMAHTSNSWMIANGACGNYIDFTANDVAANGTIPMVTLHYPFESLGSIPTPASSNVTLLYVFFSVNAVNGGAPTAFPLGNISFPSIAGSTEVNVGGIVTFAGTTTVNRPELFDQSVISVTGAANSAYNGTCANTAANSFGQLTCYQASSIGQASTSGAVLSVGSSGLGNVQGVLWQGGEMLNILDYNETNCLATSPSTGKIHAPCFDNKGLTIEPNNAAWANGDSVEEPHHYASELKASKTTYLDYDPYQLQTDDGWLFTDTGLGMCCAQVGNVAGNRAQISISNGNAAAGLYIGHGGTATPMGGIKIGSGSPTSEGYNYAIDLQNAPEPNGSGRVFYVGCPTAPYGCTDRQYRYKLFDLDNNSATNTTISYLPFTGDIILGDATNPITWNAPNSDMNFLQMRDNTKYAPMATPVIVASLPTSSTNGVIPDATQRFYTVTAKSNAGSSLASAEVSKTTGSTGSNTNSITVQWGRITGATSYQVCESSTTGTELLLATVSNTGGNLDSTYFVDTGGLTASGSCLNAATQPGPDQAGFVGVENSNGTTETKILAGTATTNISVNLPGIAGTMPVIIGTGTANMTTAAITAPACGSTVTVAATGVLTTDVITWSFNSAPAGTNAGLVSWPTANNVNFAYCPGVTQTPAAATINWRVTR